MNTKWQSRFLELATTIANWSEDPNTKVGVVIVGLANDVRSVGFNGLCRGITSTAEKLVRPEKYLHFEHAERNAIYNAARIGTALEGCTMVANLFPCMDCARAIVQSGICELVAIKPDFGNEKWGNEFRKAVALLEEVGVAIRWAE